MEQDVLRYAQESQRYNGQTQPETTQQLHAVIAPDGKAYEFRYCNDG